MATVDQEPMRKQLLDAAEQVFYARGIQAVSMAELRDAAELPFKRIYQLFPGKDDMVVAFLRRRHDRMMTAVKAYVADISCQATEHGYGPRQRGAHLTSSEVPGFDWDHGWN